MVLVLLLGLGSTLGLILGPLRRLRASERLQHETQARLRVLVDQSSDLMVICRPDLTAEYVSNASWLVAGRAPREVVNQHIIDFVHPDDRSIVETNIQRLRDAGSAGPMEVRARHGDGHWVWLEATTRLIHNERGEIAMIMLAARDISRRKRAEERLAARDRELRSTIDRAIDPFIGIDENLRIVEWNHSAERTFGYRRDEMIGRDPDETVPERVRPQLNEARMKALREGLDHPIETLVTHRDGREIPVELTVWRVDSPDRELTMSCVRDISLRKKAEQALTRAREQAVEASQLKSEFMASMSHEIRTPIGGVIGLADLLKNTELDDVQRQYVDGIALAGENLVQVINNILDFSKLEAGKVILDDLDFDLRDLVDNMVDLIAESARHKGIELVAFIDPRLPTVLRGDPGRIRQILLNLASNAVKFTAEGEVVVRAVPSTDTDLPDTVPIRFEVSDTGIGIAPAEREEIFSAFTQADASTTRKFGGTGLGLAISQKLVVSMGGQIGVESEPEKGSTFWCEIPLHLGTEPTSPSAAGGPARENLDGVRVLVVDDNATNRLVLGSQLRANRMIPVVVDGAEPALAALRDAAHRDEPFDLAILDEAMPGTPGLELARQIRSDPEIPPPHMVLLSSAMPKDPSVVRAAGLAAGLTKPVRESLLIKTLARVVSGRTPELNDPR